jgi:hypothetical protein
MEESSPRTWRAPSASMVVVGLAAVAACLIALVWVQAPPAQGKPPSQDPPTTNGADEPSFVVNCDWSHRNTDDPIVHPGDEGMSHQHEFFGNTSTKADSTYLSMAGREPITEEPTSTTEPTTSTNEDTTSTTEATTLAPENTSASETTSALEETTSTLPETTCLRKEDTSAYWIPTVYWNGKELTASEGVFYYRHGGKDPKSIVPFGEDLRIVTPQNEHERVSWRCVGQGEYSDTPPTRCTKGQLGVRIVFPDCAAVEDDATPPYNEYDMMLDGLPNREGKVNHRSHMVFANRDTNPATCPTTIDVGVDGVEDLRDTIPVPSLRVILTFPIPKTSGQVTLSEHDQGGVLTNQGTYRKMHSDFWNTWQQDDLRYLVSTCINGYPHADGRRPIDCTRSGQADAE